MKLRRLKWVIFLLIALPVAAVVAIYAMLASRDFDELRQIAEQQVQEATGRELRIEGPIDIALSLTPALAVEEVRFANAPGGSADDMAHIRQMEVQIALLPLLGGDIEIKRFLLSDAEILLETDAEGRPNWVFAEQVDDEPEEQTAESLEQTSQETRQRLPSLEALDIENARVTWRDGVSGETLVFALDDAQVREEDERLALQAAGSYQDLPFDLQGRVGAPDQLLAGGNYPLDLEGSLAGTRLDLEGSLAGLPDSPSADVQLSVEGDDLPALSLLAGRELPDVGDYSLRGGFAYDGQAASFTELEARLAESQLVADGNVTGLKDGVPAVNATIAAEGPAMERLAELAGAELPAIGAWTLNATMEGDQNRTRLSELEATFGESDISGTAEVILSGNRPALTAELQSQLLDLAALTPEGEEGEQEQEPSQDGSDSPFVIPDTPLPLDALGSANADVRVMIETLRLPNELEVEAIDLAASLDNGNLTVQPNNLSFYDGQLSGSFNLNAGQQPPVLQSDLQLQGLNFGRLLRERGISEAVEGALDAEMDLTGRGHSPRAIASSLNGSSELEVGEGVISNRLLAIIGSGLGEIMNPLFGGQDTTQLHCVISRIDFENGVANNRAALIDTSTFSVAGSGQIDLRDESLEMHFDTSSRVPALVSLAVPFNVGGTLKNPSFAPDPLGTAQRAAELAGLSVAPPAALAEMVGMSDSEAAEENPCVAALDAEAQTPAESSGPEQQLEDVGRQIQEGLGDTGEEIEQQLRGLFGD